MDDTDYDNVQYDTFRDDDPAEEAYWASLDREQYDDDSHL